MKTEDIPMLRPPALKRGDTIALLSPSSGLAAIFPHRLEAAIQFLKDAGFTVKMYPTTRGNVDGKAGTPEARARDLINSFTDADVKAIVCTIGGLSSNELLPFLDFDIIKKHPKIFCGYSDISVLHHAIFAKTGLTTFYGPCAMTQFGEYPKPFEYTVDAFLRATTQTKPLNEIRYSATWTDELLDWGTKKDRERPRTARSNEGHEWLHRGTVQGRLTGGCLYSILQLKGTEYDLDYTDAILFIETPEGENVAKGQPLSYIDSQLMDLRIAGVFDRIRGLVVGRGYGHTDEEHALFRQMVEQHTKPYGFPVLFNVNIGHCDPITTIPLNVQATLDSTKNIFSINESGVTSNNKRADSE